MAAERFAKTAPIERMPAEDQGPRSEAQRLRLAEFERRYGADWRLAVPEACRGLFNLNRFAKHSTCGWQQQADIYNLKDGFLKLLCGNGYCEAAWKHRLELPAKACRDCGGGGDGGCCDRCDGTGEYLPAKTVWFAALRFTVVVEGESSDTYIWHQPLEQVKFEVRFTETPADWKPGEREKPVYMNLRERAAAKDLLRWVLGRAEAAA